MGPFDKTSLKGTLIRYRSTTVVYATQKRSMQDINVLIKKFLICCRKKLTKVVVTINVLKMKIFLFVNETQPCNKRLLLS